MVGFGASLQLLTLTLSLYGTTGPLLLFEYMVIEKKKKRKQYSLIIQLELMIFMVILSIIDIQIRTEIWSDSDQGGVLYMFFQFPFVSLEIN